MANNLPWLHLKGKDTPARQQYKEKFISFSGMPEVVVRGFLSMFLILHDLYVRYVGYNVA